MGKIVASVLLPLFTNGSGGCTPLNGIVKVYILLYVVAIEEPFKQIHTIAEKYTF